MGSLSKQFFFKASLEKVWALFTDVERTPEWVEGVHSSRITSSIREGKGLCWEEDCTFQNFPVQMKHEITEWEPQKKAVIETELPMGGKMSRVFQFAGTGQENEVQVHWQWDLGMASGFIAEEQVQEIMESNLTRSCERWQEKVLD